MGPQFHLFVIYSIVLKRGRKNDVLHFGDHICSIGQVQVRCVIDFGKESLFNIKVFLFKKLNFNFRRPKSQPVHWNVLYNGFNNKKLDIWDEKKCVVSLFLVKKSLYNKKVFCSRNIYL
jgi:hypothetical protein